MSEQGQEVTYEVESNHTGPSSTLAERARARREKLVNQQTIVLEVPSYEGILAVEYRALDYFESRRIGDRLNRIKDEGERDLYLACDTLIAASINAFELGQENVRELGVGWGQQLAKHLGVDVADDATARQAVLSCFPRSQSAVVAFAEYTDWLTGALVDVDDEQRPDFPRRS